MEKKKKSEKGKEEIPTISLSQGEKKESKIPSRGRMFQGYVVKKFPTRVVIEFERTVYVPKYERYYKKKTKLHARLPKNMDVKVGDYIKIQECRPLSTIIHAIVIEKISSPMIKEARK